MYIGKILNPPSPNIRRVWCLMHIHTSLWTRCWVSLHSNSHFWPINSSFMHHTDYSLIKRCPKLENDTEPHPAGRVQPFQTGCFERSIFPDRSRMLRMRTAGFSSTLYLIDPLIAGTGWSSDTCYPTWLSVRWDHVSTEMQRCCSKRLHVGCLMGSFQSRYWFGSRVREQPSERIKHTGRIQGTIKHHHGSFELVFSIVHLCTMLSSLRWSSIKITGGPLMSL